MKILLILGTAREGRKSEHIYELLNEELSSRDDVELALQDVRDYKENQTIPAWTDDSRTKDWKSKAEKADGYIIVVPEYNHGYPGELKLLLDGAYEEYNKKPVLLVAVSSGALGGARVVEHTKPVLIELGMVPTRMSTHVFKVGEYLTDDGEVKEDKRVEFIKRFNNAYEEFMWLTKVLKEGRNNYPLKD